MAKDVKLRGVFFDPRHTEALHAHLTAGMSSAAASLEAKIKSKAPGPHSTGALRASVKVSVVVPKGRAKGEKRWIALRAEATATRKGTKGDAPRRYGRVPYGVFSDNKTGWLSGTVEAENGSLFAALRASAGAFITEANKSVPAPSPK